MTVTGQRSSSFGGAAVPFEPSGVAGLIRYNDLIMNDKRFADRIVITDVVGLDDADLRDSREVNPDRDGETAFNSFYAGRNISLRGYIEAGNEMMKRTLWGAVKTAFDDPVDSALDFLSQDWFEYWSGGWKQDFGVTSGSGLLSSPSYGVLAADDTSANLMTLNRRDYVDGEVLVPFTNGPSGPSTSKVGAVLKRITSNDYLLFSYQNNTLKISSVVGGVTTDLFTLAYTASNANKSYWLRGRVENSTGTLELWDSVPVDDGIPLAQGSVTVDAQFGTGVRAQSGFYLASTSSAAIRLGPVRFVGLNPGDTMIFCRKVGKIESSDSVDSGGRYRKEFLIPLRSASPNFLSRKSTTVTIPVTVAALSFPSNGSGFTFPADGSGIVFGANMAVNPVNLGRSPASPIVRIYGPCVNPGIYDYNTNTRLIVDANMVTTSQYIQFDVDKREITDQNGNSAYDLINGQTTWMMLGKGANLLLFGADSITAGTTKVTITYRHTSR